MTKTRETASTKGARQRIKAHVRKVRAENAEAHERRLNECTKAAEQAAEPKVTKVPAGQKGLGRGGKAKVLQLTSPAKKGAARKAKVATTKAKPEAGKVAATELREKITERQAGLPVLRRHSWLHRIELDGETIGELYRTNSKEHRGRYIAYVPKQMREAGVRAFQTEPMDTRDQALAAYMEWHNAGRPAAS